MSPVEETYMVVISRVGGKRSARRFPVNAPHALVTGRMEKMTDRDLNNLRRDVEHERVRRAGGFPELLNPPDTEPAARPAWDPSATQHRGASK